MKRWHALAHWARVLSLLLVASCLMPGCSSDSATESDFEADWKPPAGEPYRLRVTGRDFRWHIRYPGPDHELGTDDDIVTQRHMHLPTNTRVVLELASDDYVYSLALPHLSLKEIAVPDLQYSMEFETSSVGTHELRGDQMCGYTHPNLIGQLIVSSERDFTDWLEATGADTAGVELAPVD